MTLTLLQDAVVTIVAAWAAWQIVRRVVALVRPMKTAAPKCTACAEGCAPASDAASQPEAQPLRLYTRT